MMKGQKHRLVVDGYTRFCLTAIMVLLTVLVVGLWAEGPDLTGRSEAAPKPKMNLSAETKYRAAILAGQRELTQAAQQTNQKLDKLIRLLESGKLEVVVSNLEGGNAPGKIQKP